MLIRHPRIYVDADGTVTDAMLVRDGVVVALGSDAMLQAGDDEVISPEATCVMPALTDAHIHMWGLGLRGSVDLTDFASAEQVYDALRNASVGPSGWVLGRGWDQHRWSDADALDRVRLDACFPDHPVCLRRIDGHALWVNSRALELAGLTDDFEPAAGGGVGRTAQGALNGLLIDDAMDPVLDVLPEPTIAEDEETYLESADVLLSHGISAAHIAWMPIDRLPMLHKLRDEGRLGVRLHLMLDGNDPALQTALAEGPRHDPWLSVAAVKYFADGALGSHGAHLHAGYPGGDRGLVLETTERLIRDGKSLSESGWQVCVHAIGDAAVTSVLDAFAEYSPAARKATRPRVEHAQMVRDSDIARFAELGAVASIQPIHMFSDACWADEILNEDQLRGLFPWRRIADTGAVVSAGSDYPIEDPNPWHGIATALSRRTRDGQTFSPGEALRVEEALAAYTIGAAWSANQEAYLGTLRPGFAADFIAVDVDPFTASAEQIWETKVGTTWVAGSVKFQA